MFDPNNVDNRRCKDCGERIYVSRTDTFQWVCPHIAGLLNLDGPPWRNCRFWTKEKPSKDE